MREIKFRAWAGKEMFNVDVLAISECTWDCPDYNRKGVSLAYQPHIHVMQYTGVKDKNGQEIYEGDILDTHAQFNDMYIRTVIYKDCGLGLEPGTGFTLCKANRDHFRILGNIYENPELLEI
jgi:uncharacterized phage protein (TIGR01671 family)